MNSDEEHIYTQISMNFDPNGSINNKSIQFTAITWRRTDDKPLTWLKIKLFIDIM